SADHAPADVRCYSGASERTEAGEEAPRDAQPDDRDAQGRVRVRDVDTGRRQSGPGSSASLAEHRRVWHEPSGGGRSAAFSDGALLRVVRFPRLKAGARKP